MPATLLPPRQYDQPPPMPVIEHVLNYQTLQVWGSMFPGEGLLLFIKDTRRCDPGLWDGLFGVRKAPAFTRPCRVLERIGALRVMRRMALHTGHAARGRC